MRLLLASGVSLTLTFAGCLTIEEMAPPVGPEFLRTRTKNDVALSVLERGREVYLADCTRCHSVEPISRYSKNHWHTIIARMGPPTKVEEASTAALPPYCLHTNLRLTPDPDPIFLRFTDIIP